MAGTLYLIATPIGNLEDMTYRAVRLLGEVDLIAAEDTRNSIKLLNHFDIKTPMTSYHEHNKYEKAQVLVGKLLEGMNIAVMPRLWYMTVFTLFFSLYTLLYIGNGEICFLSFLCINDEVGSKK